jgi:VWFA-related protein
MRPARGLRLTLAAALSAGLTGAPASGQRPQASPKGVPTFGAGVSLVRVTVVVRDKAGALVRGLKVDDFELLEDDKPQTITAFDFEEVSTTSAPDVGADASERFAILTPTAPAQLQAAPAPATRPSTPLDLAGRRLVVLLFDTNTMEPEQLERALQSAHGYVDARMAEADLLAVASIANGLDVLQDFTSDRALLRSALDRLAGAEELGSEAAAASAAGAADDSSQTESFSADTTELDLFNIDRRLRAIQQLADALAPVQQKKSVVYFSSGTSGIGADNLVELRAAIDRAVKANLSIYPVDARGLEAVVPGGPASQASGRGTDVYSGRALARQADQLIASQDTLSALASDTGGRAFLDSNDFSGVYERLMADSSAYYILGYTSTNSARDGKLRRVKVRVKQPNLRVEHRRGYHAERDFAHAGREDRDRQIEEQLFADLSATDFPVWVQAAYFRVGDKRFYVPLSVAVPGSAIPFAQAGEKDRATLDIIGVVRDEGRRAVARLRDTIRIAAEGTQDIRHKSVQYQTGFALPPGKFRLKVVVRENQEGAFGSFEADLTVPDLRTSAVKVSSVVLGTQVQKAGPDDEANPLARQGSKLVPSVTHVVGTSQPLYFYYEVYDPARAEGGEPRLLTSIAFFRGKVRRYETNLVEVRRLTAPERGAAIFQFSVPPGSLRPGLYACQVNVVDDVAGAFTFPRLALLVR